MAFLADKDFDIYLILAGILDVNLLSRCVLPKQWG